MFLINTRIYFMNASSITHSLVHFPVFLGNWERQRDISSILLLFYLSSIYVQEIQLIRIVNLSVFMMSTERSHCIVLWPLWHTLTIVYTSSPSWASRYWQSPVQCKSFHFSIFKKYNTQHDIVEKMLMFLFSELFIMHKIFSV